MAHKTEYFGSDAQRALLHRGRLTFDITAHNPRFTFYGRTVGLASPEDGTFHELAALAQLQGNASYAKVPDAQMPALVHQAVAQGFTPVTYARWEGATQAIQKARDILASTALPDKLHPVWLTHETDDELASSFADMALECGVLPPSRSALTGQTKPGRTLLAVTSDGQVAACAAACAVLNTGHVDATKECWWGMLATDPSWRGHRVSLILGARVLLDMAEQHGFTRFFTGVEPGNAPSEAICSRIGLRHKGFSIMGIADTSLLPGGRMTK